MVAQAITSLADIRARIGMAKKAKTELSLEELQDQINAKQAIIDIENKKQKTLETVMEAARREKDRLDRDLADIKAVESFMTQAEVAEANSLILATVNAIEKKILEDQAMYTQLREATQKLVLEVTVLRDRKSAMSDPRYAPRFAENKTTDVYLCGCRQELVDIWNTISSLPTRFKEHEPDNQACILTVKLQAGRFRKVQKDLKHSATDAEEIMCRRCVQRLSEYGNTVNVGYLHACVLTYETDWDEYVKDAQAKLAEHFAKKQKRMETPPTPLSVAPVNGNGNGHAKPEEEPEDADDVKLITQLLNSNLCNHTDKKRLAIYGGISTRSANEKLREWLKDVLKLERLEWYECVEGSGANETKRLIHSINQGGTDLVLIFYKMAGHSGWNHVVTACKGRGIKSVMCGGTSKRMAVQQIALSFGIGLEKAAVK